MVLLHQTNNQKKGNLMAIGILIRPTSLGWNVDCLTCDKNVASVYTKELADASELDHIAHSHLATHEVV